MRCIGRTVASSRRLLRELSPFLLAAPLALAVLLPAVPAFAGTTTTVTTVADDLAANGNCSLREAIRAANLDQAVDACPAGHGADTIILPPGKYVLAIPGVNENDGLTGDFDITGDALIRGAGPDLTIVDGNLMDRIFEVAGPSTVTLAELTVQHGFHGAVWPDDEPLGAGIRNNNGNLTLTHVHVVNNTGHAFQNAFGKLVTECSLIADNSAEAIGSSNSLVIRNSTITPNHHTTWCCGGGAISTDGTSLIEDSTISNNSSTSGGGGILNWRRMTIVNSTITGNYTAGGGPSGDQGPGGGINNASGGTLTLINSTISNNSARGNGGGLHTNSDPEGVGLVFLYNTTIADNMADSDASGVGDGGGVYNGGAAITAHNSLIANNVDHGGQVPDCFGPVASQGFNLIRTITGCAISGTTTGNIYGLDPKLGPLQDNGGPGPHARCCRAARPSTPGIPRLPRRAPLLVRS